MGMNDDKVKYYIVINSVSYFFPPFYGFSLQNFVFKFATRGY